MTVYEFGDETKPAIMLLPGACCYWNVLLENELRRGYPAAPGEVPGVRGVLRRFRRYRNPLRAYLTPEPRVSPPFRKN
mgnify:CR=1 FL=1